jgi:hypothetical protein
MKYGPTLNPGLASLYRRTENEPADPPWLPAGAPPPPPALLPVARLRRPAGGAVELIADGGIDACAIEAADNLLDANSHCTCVD